MKKFITAMKHRISYLCDTRPSPAWLPRYCPFDKGSKAPNLFIWQKIIMCFTLDTMYNLC